MDLPLAPKAQAGFGFMVTIKSDVMEKSASGICCVPSCILRIKPISGDNKKFEKCFIALVLSNKLALIIFFKSQK